MEYEQEILEGVCGQARWRLIKIGLISELKLHLHSNSYVYILVFYDDKQNDLYSAKIARFIQDIDLNQGLEENRKDIFRDQVEKYLTSLTSRTILTKVELIEMQNSNIKLPYFYQQAIKGDVEKIIIF